MLKARSGDKYVFGLSAKNIERLMDGQPILIELSQLGGTGSVFIFYGINEQIMVQQLEDAGIVLDKAPS